MPLPMTLPMTLPQEAVVWGGRGLCRVVAEITAAERRRNLADCDREDLEPPLPGVPLLHGRERLLERIAGAQPSAPGFMEALRGGRGADRIEVADFLVGAGLSERSAIRRAGVVEPSAGPGALLCAASIVNADVRVGRQTMLDLEAVDRAAPADHRRGRDRRRRRGRGARPWRRAPP